VKRRNFHRPFGNVDSSTRIDGSIANMTGFSSRWGEGGTAAVLNSERPDYHHVGRVVKIIDASFCPSTQVPASSDGMLSKPPWVMRREVAVGTKSVSSLWEHNLAEVRVLKHGIK